MTDTMVLARAIASSGVLRLLSPADYLDIMDLEWKNPRSDLNLLVLPVASNATVAKRAAVLRSPVDGHRSAVVVPRGPTAFLFPRTLSLMLAMRLVCVPLIIGMVAVGGALGGSGAHERPSSGLSAALDLVAATENSAADLVPAPPAPMVPLPPQPPWEPPPRAVVPMLPRCYRRCISGLPCTPAGVSYCAGYAGAMGPSP